MVAALGIVTPVFNDWAALARLLAQIGASTMSRSDATRTASR